VKEWFDGKWFVEHLRCPNCGNVMRIGVEISCSVCDYHKALHAPIDLRPSRPRIIAIDLNAVILADPNDILEQINIGLPKITYDGPPAQRDSRELISEMMRSVPLNGRVLDLGCGPQGSGPTHRVGRIPVCGR
jgi:hypothetical protein